MFLMVGIFLMELIFSIVPKFIGDITNLVAKLLLGVSQEEYRLREEVKSIKEEQSHLSMTDSFVQYARLQRRVDKLMADIKRMGGERQQKAAYLKMGLSMGMHVLRGLLMIILVVYYRSEPLMYLPSDWVSPLSMVVAFPSGVHGALGLGCWVMVSNSVIKRGKTLAGL